MKHVQCVQDDCDQALPDLLRQHRDNLDLLLVDPPRDGLPPQTVAEIRASTARALIYVSCHPATLARDLKRLIEGGAWVVQSITPLDLFPATAHIECVAHCLPASAAS